MPSEIEEIADDELLLTDDDIEDQDEAEQPDDDDGDIGDDDIVLLDDEEDEPEPAAGHDSTLVKYLRRQLAEAKKRNAAAPAQPKPKVVVGPKPDLEDMGYDAEAYDKAMDEWRDRKAAAERQDQDEQQARTAEQDQWADANRSYAERKAKLPYADKDDAEDVVASTLSGVQQAVILKAADNPALVIYALGKRSAKLDDLAEIEDPLKFAAAVARFEGALKVTKRKAPAPEKIIAGKAPAVKTSDRKLEALRKEAEKTGDYTAVAQFKRSMRA